MESEFSIRASGMWDDNRSKGYTTNSDERKPGFSGLKKGLGEQLKIQFKVAAYNADGLAFNDVDFLRLIKIS